MSPMLSLVLACTTLVGSHVLLSHVRRDAMVRSLGEGVFQGLYSLVALASFGWIIFAWRAMPAAAPAYVPGDAAWAVASAAMLFASVLLAGSFFGNPALPSPNARSSAVRNPVGVFAITRHPMMWSFAIWALVHSLLWPTPENHILTTAILVLALGGALGQDAKKARLMADAWRGWMRRTAFVPFFGQLSGRVSWGAAWPGTIALVGGTLIWLAATWAHMPLGARMAAGVWHWL